MLEFVGITVFVLLAVLVTGGFVLYPFVWLFRMVFDGKA